MSWRNVRQEGFEPPQPEGTRFTAGPGSPTPALTRGAIAGTRTRTCKDHNLPCTPVHHDHRADVACPWRLSNPRPSPYKAVTHANWASRASSLGRSRTSNLPVNGRPLLPVELRGNGRAHGTRTPTVRIKNPEPVQSGAGLAFRVPPEALEREQAAAPRARVAPHPDACPWDGSNVRPPGS